MKSFLLFVPLALLFCGCSKTSNKTFKPSNTPFQREVCLDWYGYRINTEKAIADLNLKITVESELMAYCDFFKNVAGNQ